jgi:divalent metal cation (Fe/Co/Zn/Cd) transporter
MKSLLIGEGASREHERSILEALPGDGVDSVIHMKTMHLGPEELLIGAKIAVSATATGEEVARAIDAAERRVRSAVPIARVVYLEPDLLRTASARSAPGATGPSTGDV